MPDRAEVHAEPLPELPTDGPATVQRCKCGAPQHATDAHICARGHTWKRNRRAMKHGFHSRQVARAELPEQEATRAALAERRAGLVAHCGGSNPVKAPVVDAFLTTTVILDYLAVNIIAAGPLTGKGKTRAATTTYLAVVDRLLRLASVLGVEATPKPAPTLDQLLAELHAEKDEDTVNGERVAATNDNTHNEGDDDAEQQP